MFSVAVYTLGCKLNQLESEAVASAFRQAGCSLVPWGDASPEGRSPPDLLLINTCTVTSKADQKARRIIRKALRDNPNSRVMVTGCYAHLEAEAVEALEAESSPPSGKGAAERRLFVLKGGTGSAGALKSALLDLPWCLRTLPGPPNAADLSLFLDKWLESLNNADRGNGQFRFIPEDFSFHTRGFLKIQDGCDQHCTYCRVRLARGPSVSLPAEQALAELRALEAKGRAEAMITGVNITQYRNGALGLGELLAYLLEGTRRIALRLSSLEPDKVNEQLAASLTHPRIRPHFHLSVQSGSASVLARMGRNYGSETVEQAAALFRSVKDNPFLACDIITGFPGETEAEFEKTLALCRNTGFAWIHAFPYSRRPGTAAYCFQEQAGEGEAVRRVGILLDLAGEGKRNYIRSWAGRETEVIIEEENSPRPGYCRGISENYLKLMVKYPDPRPPLPGTVMRCVIGEAAEISGCDALAFVPQPGTA